MSYHISVLLNEALDYLLIRPGKTYVDMTFGGGGHTRGILEADPTCHVIAFDWDRKAIDLNGPPLQALFPGRLKLVWSSFARLELQLKQLGIAKVAGILADFGTSRYQIDHADGFSYSRDTPLDMRMSQAHGQVTACEIVNNSSLDELTYILSTYGEERHARIIAQAIITSRGEKPLLRTGQLVQLIERLFPPRYGTIHPSTRTFQALRIVVNKEMENIEALLKQASRFVETGGRLVCISFHSLEDRLVKREMVRDKSIWKVITQRVISPSQGEVESNLASRSAKLRAAVRL